MRASPIVPQLLPTNPRNGRHVISTRVRLRGRGGTISDGGGGGPLISRVVSVRPPDIHAGSVISVGAVGPAPGELGNVGTAGSADSSDRASTSPPITRSPGSTPARAHGAARPRRDPRP